MLSSACFSQWFSQPLPVNGQVQDLKFFDANTGLILMNEPFRIYRTTNGGYHWDSTIQNQYITLIDVIDSTTVYGVGAFSNGSKQIIRSYDRGLTWDSMSVTVLQTINGISFVNPNTGWIGGTTGALPFLWRTTNAGVTWTIQSDDTGFGKVFFLKQKVNGEYVGWSQQEDVATYKTTNSGVNWFQIQNVGAVTQLQFKNQYTGYAAYFNCLKITTNGGMNWIANYLPNDSELVFNQINLFKFVNKDTIYGDYGSRYFGGQTFRGVIWLSTNGGVNWGFQQPDTNINRNRYSGIDFVNKDTGWSSGIRTNNGGGPVIYPTYIDSNSAVIPSDYVLKQNYPNPFNPSTTIEFSLPKDSYVKMKITDISGRTVFWVIYDMLLYSGLHRFKITDFSRLSLSSGVYFYRLEAREKNNGKTYFTPSRKMLYIK